MSETTIVILIDALGFELAERNGFSPEGLERRARLGTVLGYSGAALASIFTGLPPDRHGLWMMYSFASGASPFSWLKHLPPSVSMRRLWLRRLLRWKLTYIHGIKGYYSLYDIPRSVMPYIDIPARGDLFAPRGTGSVRTILDEVSARRMPGRVWDYHGDEEGAFGELASTVSRAERGFYLLYTARLDAELHRSGCRDPGVASRFERYGKLIQRVREAAFARGRTARLFVLGDHGMCDVKSHVDLMTPVESIGLTVPDDYIPFFDSTMARFRINSERARTALADLLAAQPFGHVLSPQEMTALGVSFPDGRFGDVVFLVDPGTIIVPSFMGREPVAAMHGYHPDAACMHSVLFSNVDLPGEHISICDIAPIVLPGFDGVVQRGSHDY
jgi:hypothetical protein